MSSQRIERAMEIHAEIARKVRARYSAPDAHHAAIVAEIDQIIQVMIWDQLDDIRMNLMERPQ